MRRYLIALLATTMLVTVQIPVNPASAADPPTCQFGSESDSDGDGWGWENEATCVVDNSSGSGTTNNVECDYGSASQSGGWGYNPATGDGTGCPPENNPNTTVGSPVNSSPARAAAPSVPTRLSISRILNLENEAAVATLVWQPSETPDGQPADGYEIYRNGELARRVVVSVHQRIFSDTMTLSESLRPVDYSIRAYSGDGDQRTFGPEATLTLRGYLAPPDGPSTAFERIIGSQFASQPSSWHVQVSDLFFSAHVRNQTALLPVNSTSLLPINEAELLKLVALLEGAGFDTGITRTSYANNQTLLRSDNKQLVDKLVATSTPQRLADVIPGYGYRDIDYTRILLFNHPQPQSSPALQAWQRADKFEANEPVVQELFDALPEKMKSSGPPRAAGKAAFDQAYTLLQAGPYSVNWLRRTAVYIEDGLGGSSEFARLWNEATPEERVAYYGIDPTAWELALPYVEAGDKLLDIAKEIDDQPSIFEVLFVGIFVGILTGGIGGVLFGEATAGAAIFGATTGAYTTTYLLTGSTSQAEKSAFGALLTAGVNHFLSIPSIDRTWQQNLGIAVMRGGLAELQGGDFEDGVLTSLGQQYVPGLASYLESLDGVSPFVADLASTMVVSYIRHDGNWDRVADDLEAAIVEGAGDYVSNYVGEALPASWGNVGTSLGDIARVAVVSGGDETKIRQAVDSQAAFLVSQGVIDAFGSGDSWRSEVVTEVATIWRDSRGKPPSERSRYIDEQLTAYVFGAAGDSLSSSFRNQLTSSNNGQSSRLIDTSTGLINVVISNMWRDNDGLQEAVNGYLAGELRSLFSDATPGCLPDWVDQMAGVAIDGIVTGDSSQDLERRLTTFVTNTAQSGDFSELGTCGNPGSNPEPPGGTNPGDPNCDNPTGTVGSGGSGGFSATSGSAVKQATAQVTAAPGVCQTSAQFRDWLIGLTALDFAANKIVFDTRSDGKKQGRVNTSANNADFGDQFRVVFTDNATIGLIVQRTHTGNYLPTADNVGLVRDNSRDVVGFVEADVAGLFDNFISGLEQTSAALAMIETMLSTVRNAGSGCYLSATDNIAALKAAILEYWNSESNWDYILQKWAEIQEIKAAIEQDPQGFVVFFLGEVFRADLYSQDAALWAGAITCDLIFALLTRGIGTIAIQVAKLFSSQGLADIRRWRDNLNVPRDFCNNSFPTGTLVLMGDGSRKPINLIQPGDQVVSANEETGQWAVREVVDQWSHLDQGAMATVTLADGSSVSATDHHNFWVASDGAWVELEDVVPGDLLLTPDGVTQVESLEMSSQTSTLVWELDVAVDDTFTVFTGTEDLLVHNCNRNPNWTPPKNWKSPRPERGSWEGPVGNSWFKISDAAAAEVNDKLPDGYRRMRAGEKINFINGVPDFSPWSWGIDFVPLAFKMPDDVLFDNSSSGMNAVRREMLRLDPSFGTLERVEAALRDLEFTPHHYLDRMIQLVPKAVHGTFRHSGPDKSESYH